MSAAPSPTPRLFVAGEALIDLVAEPDGRFRPIPGGSPANVAVGLSRLGASTSLLARLGTSTFGDTVRAHLEADGVDLAHAVTTADPTTLAVVTLDEQGRATYDFYADGTADWGWTADELPDPLPDGTLALVTGSIAAAREPGASALLELLRREHRRGEVSIVVDPNLRPSLLGPHDEVRARWDELIGLSDVVKVSDEDLEWLVPGEPPADVAADWAGRGPALVVVTYGADGALGVTSAGTSVRVATPPVDVVDTVGAGDSFTAGLVDGLRLAGMLARAGRERLAGSDEDGLRAVLDRAALVAAITCGRAGADPPTAADVDMDAPAR